MPHEDLFMAADKLCGYITAWVHLSHEQEWNEGEKAIWLREGPEIFEASTIECAFEERQLGHLVAIPKRISRTDRPTPIVTGDLDLVVAERADELVNVLRDVREVVPALGDLGEAHAAQVGNDHAVRLGEFGGDKAPDFSRLRIAVQQHDRITLARHRDMQIDAVDLDDVRLETELRPAIFGLRNKRLVARRFV